MVEVSAILCSKCTMPKTVSGRNKFPLRMDVFLTRVQFLNHVSMIEFALCIAVQPGAYPAAISGGSAKALFLYFPGMRTLLVSILLLGSAMAWAQSDDFATVFERSNGTETATYAEGIAYWERLAAAEPQITMLTMGMTDSGIPLHLVVYGPEGRTDFFNLHEDGYTIFLINNAIHPGEADGVEASMMMMRDVAMGKRAFGDSVVIAVIPFYNIGGTLNRNSTTRFNQDGPTDYGFRGNGRNYDLNRDFVKSDTKNAWSFQEIFQRVNPDLFLDTHVTNGSDHQYHLTLLSTLPEQLGQPLGDYLKETINPYLFADMEEKGCEMTPYVNVHGRLPNNGWSHFYDSPRYSSGYASLFHTVGFMSEAHALKPWADRVPHTYELMCSMLLFAQEHGKELQRIRKQNQDWFAAEESYVTEWTVDRAAPTTPFDFKGYEVDTIEGKLTGAPIYQYNREKPYTRTIPLYNTYKAKTEVRKPEGYYIPQAWWPVVDRLLQNGVEVEEIDEAAPIVVEQYIIDDYGTYESPYEGHYPHYNVAHNTDEGPFVVMMQPGDFYVSLDQASAKYIMHVLEPSSRDSFFNWNMFDTILQQKEGASGYMLEMRVDELTEAMPDWEEQWKKAVEEDPELAENPRMLMYWLYQNGPFKEKAHLRYPIYRG